MFCFVNAKTGKYILSKSYEMRTEHYVNFVVLKDTTFFEIGSVFSLNIPRKGCNLLQTTFTNFETRLWYLSGFLTVEADIVYFHFGTLTRAFIYRGRSKRFAKISKMFSCA